MSVEMENPHSIYRQKQLHATLFFEIREFCLFMQATLQKNVSY